MTAHSSLTTQVHELLVMLSRHAGPAAFLTIDAARDGAVLVPAADLRGRALPAGVLNILTNSAAPWSIRLAATSGPRRVLSALAVSFEYQLAYFNPRLPASPHGKRWAWPQDAIDAALLRAESVLPPSAIVDGRRRVSCVWFLSAPLVANVAAYELLRRLAAAVGAVPPPTLDSLAVPMPGMPIEHQRPEIVVVERLDLSRVYDLTAIEAAIGAATVTSPETITATARRRRENAR